MVSIDTIMPQNGPVRIGDRTFPGVGAVPLKLWMRVFFEIVRARRQKRRTRMQLGELTPEQLLDIGVTAAEARIEADKPAWWYSR